MGNQERNPGNLGRTAAAPSHSDLTAHDLVTQEEFGQIRSSATSDKVDESA